MKKERVLDYFKRCCASVLPEKRIKEVLQIHKQHLSIKIDDETSYSIPLTPEKSIYLVAFGKASLTMTYCAEQALSTYFRKGIVIAPTNQMEDDHNLLSDVYYGGKNNYPDENSILATEKVIEFLKEIDHKDSIIIFLISGGGSALLCSPDGVTLQEKLLVMQKLIAKGATIMEMNIVRQKLSKVKGGKLLQYTKESQLFSLILSDVIGDHLDIIASGPTVISPETRETPLQVLHDLTIRLADLPTSAQAALVKPCEERYIANVKNHIIISNSIALNHLSQCLTDDGYNAYIITKELFGNAERRGEEFAKLIMNENKRECLLKSYYKYKSDEPLVTSKLALIFGGETTAFLRGNGVGGRSQELALSCIKKLNSEKFFTKQPYIFMSAGTDGIDGPNDAAGAIFTGEEVLKTTETRCSQYLLNSDSYFFWNEFLQGSCHIKIGPTGTNVMDIQLLIFD